MCCSREVHHRVKNNLQVISSLLTMQSLHVTDEKVKETLKDALDRIHSMGLVHQTLYERNLASNVDLATYFGKLAEALANSYSSGKGGVTVEVEVEGVPGPGTRRAAGACWPTKCCPMP